MRFDELHSFENVFEPSIEEARSGDYFIKGKWREKHFLNKNPLVLELGCGKGEYSIGLAQAYPKKNFIGVDIKGARMWRGAKTAISEEIKNVAFLRTRIEMIQSFFEVDEVDEIWITFPDPQEKNRRRKKRLTAAGFLNSYRSFLKDNGIVNLKTDNDLLYEYTLAIIDFNKLELEYKSNNVHSTDTNNKLLQIKTHYEKLFIKENKNINYIRFKLSKNKEIIEPPYKD